uniref:Uncharacterized protein n=1 Tax=Anguilla anguilla TaxID=7936 RepID=A0A0E9RK76_ANGAN
MRCWPGSSVRKIQEVILKIPPKVYLHICTQFILKSF